MRKLRNGEHLEGRYVVRDLIASGGQAHVYRGVHVALDREVAVKLLKNHGSAEVRSRMIKRFEQEARLISKLKDAHTITLYDFGKLEDGALFMVFEYVDGVSLKELLAAGGPVAPYRVAKILKQTLSSLHEAHSFGVLHRDIKPANIMIYEHAGRADLVKLLDFGIAKIRREQSAEELEGLTGNNLVGTPRYIAPEVYQSSENLGPRSDLYSLGLVAYELLVGEPAVKGETAIAVFRQQFGSGSIKLPELPGLPEGLRRIIDRMLERDPQSRHTSSEHVLWELRGWQQSRFVAHVTSSSSSSHPIVEAFDPQDLDIPDPYDDMAPTQNLPGYALALSGAEDPSADDITLNDSSELVRRVNPSPAPSRALTSGEGKTRPMAAHRGAQRAPMTLYATGGAKAAEARSAPARRDFSDERTESLSGIIPAELYAQQLFEAQDDAERQQQDADPTSEIELTEALRRDAARALKRSDDLTRRAHPAIGQERDQDEEDTEAFKTLQNAAIRRASRGATPVSKPDDA